MKRINPMSIKYFVSVGDSDSKSLVLLTQLPKKLMVSTKRGKKTNEQELPKKTNGKKCKQLNTTTNWRPSQSECSEGFIQCVSVSKQQIYMSG